MQRKTNNDNISGKTLSPFDSIGALFTIDGTASNSMHICLPLKIIKATINDVDIDTDLITVRNFSHI